MRDFTEASTQTPIIMPMTVEAVQRPDSVSENPICFDKNVASQIMIP